MADIIYWQTLAGELELIKEFIIDSENSLNEKLSLLLSVAGADRGRSACA